MNWSNDALRGEGSPGVEILTQGSGHHLGQKQARDLIEDADFEVIGSAAGSERRSPFPPPPLMPDPRPATDFHRREGDAASARERLDLFGKSTESDGRSTASLAGPAFAATICLAAGVAFWMAGGHALFIAPPSPSADPIVTATVPGPASAAAVANPISPTRSAERVEGASIRLQRASEPAEAAASKPRPARIERAGSILMIRSGE